MGWSGSKQKPSENELGDHLPDSEAQPRIESKRIQANNQKQADEKCDKVAKEYGGTDPKAKPIGPKLFDCKFKIWS